MFILLFKCPLTTAPVENSRYILRNIFIILETKTALFTHFVFSFYFFTWIHYNDT